MSLFPLPITALKHTSAAEAQMCRARSEKSSLQRCGQSGTRTGRCVELLRVSVPSTVSHPKLVPLSLGFSRAACFRSSLRPSWQAGTAPSLRKLSWEGRRPPIPEALSAAPGGSQDTNVHQNPPHATWNMLSSQSSWRRPKRAANGVP